MIIIEASHIYFGGGYVLLVQVLDYLESNSKYSMVYVAYDSVFESLIKNNFTYIKIIKTNSFKTLGRYFSNRENVLFFCNLPPFVFNKKSVTYFHNVHFVERPIFDFKYIKEFFYYYWIKFFNKNTDYVVCQTNVVREKIEKLSKRVLVIPFFLALKNLNLKKEFDFCYVGSGKRHKNYSTLLNSVEYLSYKFNFSLAITISDIDENKYIIDRVNFINDKFGRTIIFNFGLVDQIDVEYIYSKSKALIFPSLKESFGLPLIEAFSCGLKVLSSDLPFTYEIIDNPIVFDPYSEEDLARVMRDFLIHGFDHIDQKLLVKSNLYELIELIS